MRRSPYVVIGTVAGVAGILSFHTSRGHLVVPGASSSASPASSGGATSPSASSPPTGTGGTSPTTAHSSGATPSTTAPAASGTRTATGSDITYPYGDLAVEVTVTGTRITAVSLATLNDNDPRSAFIDQQATPILRQQILAAGNLDIDGVSGATYTSQAYVDSVQSALDKLGVK